MAERRRRHNLTVTIGPDTIPYTRDEYVERILTLENLGHVVENPDAAYCAIPLTNTPQELKSNLKRRQELIKEALRRAGITGYDPEDAPLSPDRDLSAAPDRVYREDTAKIAGAKFFTALKGIPSEGVGVEMQRATQLNKIALAFHDVGIRTSRMMPSRMINLGYRDLEGQLDQVTAIFKMVSCYAPGMGFDGDVPVLLGFGARGGVVNLEKLVYRNFPELAFQFDREAPAAIMQVANPHIFGSINVR